MASSTGNIQGVFVEGVIAAGKTELVRSLVATINSSPHRRTGTATTVRAVAVYEPLERWERIGILKKFYADPRGYAYKFQTYVYTTQIQTIQRAVAAVDPAELSRTVFVFERSPISDEIFMELQRGTVEEMDMEMYEDWRRTFEPLIPINMSAASVIYLKPSLAVCMQRLAHRNRDGEVAPSDAVEAPSDAAEAPKKSGVTLDYQRRLERAHEALLQGRHAEEFPQLALRPPPYPRESILVVSEELADLNFRDPGPTQGTVITELLKYLGIEPAQ